jgi:hypothetical protein
MTMPLGITPISPRGLIVIALVGLWLYGLIAWGSYPNGAAATLKGLIGFMALGLTPWIARPAEGAKFFRVAGTVTILVAFALFLSLYLMLQGGL